MNLRDTTLLPHIRLVTEVELPCEGMSRGTFLRYRSAQLSWQLYCADRNIPTHDAEDQALLSWLTERCREHRTRRRARISLAALRNLQRIVLARDGLEGVPYTTSARPRLDAWLRTYIGEDPTPKRAAALSLVRLLQSVRATLHDIAPRGGTNRERAAKLAIRDATLLCVAWWAAFRADDIARLLWSGVTFSPEGVLLELERSKTGPARLALTRLPDLDTCCPVSLLERWREHQLACGLVFGCVFGLRAADVDRVVRRRTRELGHYTGHSLRAGFATEAARQGIDDRLVRRHARWKSSAIHDQYVREGRLWIDTPTRLFSLPDEAQ